MRRQLLVVFLMAAVDSCHSFQLLLQMPPTVQRGAPHLQAAADLPEMEDLPSMEPFAHDIDPPQLVKVHDDINITIDDALPLAPPLTFNKFLTMQVRSTFCHHRVLCWLFME